MACKTNSMMSRIYFRIFLGFWLVTILALLGSSLIIHWFNLGADKHLASHQEEHFDVPGARLSREIVSEAVNHSLREVRYGIKELPHWVFKHFYIVDDQNNEIIGREIPAYFWPHLNKITVENPLYRKKDSKHFYHGRYLQLADGNAVRLITFPPNNRTFGWQLYFYNVSGFLFACFVISGGACFMLARFLTRDFNTLKNATVRLAKGDWDVRIADKIITGRSEFKELAIAFDHMVANLQKSMLEQKRMIKDVSHELRSPLARLQVALAIAQQKSTHGINDELEKIKDAADYLNDVISNILSLPANDNEPWQLTDTIELNSLLETLQENFETEADAKNIDIIFHTTVHEALVLSRGLTLVSVFDNIIRNAIHYTHPNTSVSIVLRKLDADQYQVTIEDNGPGVPEEHIKDIFEPFFRTSEARDRQSGGYGLGLAISQRTVCLHGGDIIAQNSKAPQQGLTIAVTLPAAEEL